MRRAALGSAAVLALALLVGGVLMRQAERRWAAEQRVAASQVAAGAAFALEQQVSRALSATYTLAALVHHDERVEGFDELAAWLFPHFGGVASLQLAPGAVVSRIYPLKGNEAAMGHDLLRDPDRRFQALEAIRSRRLTVAGPFELRQGGAGLVGRLAIHLPDASAPGGERFWGLATAVLRVKPLLEAAQLSRLDQAGLRYQLTWHNPEHAQAVECFAGCDAPLQTPVAFEVGVPNGNWTLAVAPRDGWPALPWRATGWLVIAVVAAATTFLSYQVFRLPLVLRREVEARTAELARSNEILADEMRRLRAAEEATRAAEDALRQAQKMEAVGRLAGGVAHDFNNLLTGILAHAGMLREETAPGSEAREAAETITTAARRAADLTRGLLGLARREPVRRERFEAHAVVEEVARLLSRTLDARIAVSTRLGAARATVEGDPGQLQQALLNLALNARDAMREGGELRIETALAERDAGWLERHPGARGGTHLVLSVTDSGPGVPAELAQRIFEPFFTTKGVGHGTGLGLSLVYGAAAAHGGAVELESPPGGGARFAISLPLAAGQVKPSPPGAPAEAPPRGSGRILVIDDHDVPRETALRVLRGAGYDAHGASSAAEGVTWFRAHAPEVRAVLLDVVMPGTDGLACREQLLAIAPVPIVFTSGFSGDDRAQILAARGEAGFLPKPFDGAALLEVIGRAAR